MSEFFGLPTGVIENRFLRVEYLAQAGPRIVRCSTPGGENLLAELPFKKITTSFGDHFLRRGHRLWVAPEESPLTYLPDNDGLTVQSTATSAVLTGKTEVLSGFRKRIEIRLHDDAAALTLTHSLTNEGSEMKECAPWAITMLPLGGLGVFPQDQSAAGLLPNRLLALWPYTRLTDPRLNLDDDYIFLAAQPALPACKIGYFSQRGWMGYLRDGVFFVKRFTAYPGLPHADKGCNAETFCDNRFIELESLAPLIQLAPGETARHVEMWQVFPAHSAPTPQGAHTPQGTPTPQGAPTSQGARSLASSLGLEVDSPIQMDIRGL